VRVAITIDSAGDGFAMAAGNRLAWHVSELVAALPQVERVFVVNTQVPGAAHEALERCDLVIAMGGRIAAPDIARFRARGGRHVLFLRDNPYLDLVDRSLFDRGGGFGPVDGHDAVWVLDGFAVQASMLRAIHRCPVHCLPQVWSASFVDWHDRLHPGQPFAFARGAGPWRCVINASNVSAATMGVLPLLAVNRMHLDNPGAIAGVAFRSGAQLSEHPTFNHIAASLELHHAGALTLWADQDFHRLMALHGDCVLAHRLDAGAEPWLLDTLHAGYPLLHNAAALADLGNYYPGNDIDCAVAQAGAMIGGHLRDFDARLADTRRRLGRFAIDHRDTVAAYSRAMGL
jgi:hypothetical protein